VKTAISELNDRLVNSPLGQFPSIRLHFLLHGVLPKEGKQRLTTEQQNAYLDLIGSLKILKNVSMNYESFMRYSYWELFDCLRAFNRSIALDQDYDHIYEGTVLQMVEDILRQTGDKSAAQIVYAMYKKITHEEAEIYVTSVVETLRQIPEENP
jgi:hypothetical protein